MQRIRGEEDIRQGLAALALLDPRLVPVIAASGAVPLRLSEAGFAGLAHIIVSQVVSKASAEAIWRRIGAAVHPPSDTITAQAYLGIDAALAAGLGLTRAKAETLDRVARAVVDGELDLAALASLDAQEAIAVLTGIKGIGLWTAEVYLMFCGGHPDVFPSGDVALQSAVGHAFGHNVRPAGKVLRAMAQEWAPWRSVAARLFWRYYAVRLRADATPAI